MLLTAEGKCTKGCLLRCSMLRRNWGRSGMLGSPPQRQQQRCPPEFGRCKRVRSLGSKKEEQKGPLQAPGEASKNKQSEISQEDPKWNILVWKEYQKPWEVPWGWKETGLGFLGWILSFLLTSLITIPAILAFTQTSLQELTSQQKAGYILLNQAIETVLGIFIIRYLLRNYEPLPADIFKASLRRPFSKPDGWVLWGILGIAAAPFLVSLTLSIFTAAGYTDKGASTVDEVVKIISPDPLTFAGLFAVTAILAPILEEFVFRGFLLTSFTKFMPVPNAIALSSVAFGLAHLSAKDLPELIVLGVLLSLAYIRSRNLLTPILIHGLWNGTVLLALFAFAKNST